MLNRGLCIAGMCLGLLLIGQVVSAAPGHPPPTATQPVTTPPSATPPVTTAPPAAAPTRMPVPERTAAPVVPTAIRPISTEKDHKMAQAKKFLWWGAGFSIGGALIAGIGGGVLGRCFSPAHEGSDDDCGILGFSLIGVGIITILASTPVWIVGLVKKSKAEQMEGRRRILPKSRTVVDRAQRRYDRRLVQRSGPPAVPVLTYGFRF